MTVPVQHRRRPTILLAGAQTRYQLRLLLRNRMSTFTILVIPLMLLVALDLVGPSFPPRDLNGEKYAEFLTPAMAVFGLLNASYVNVATSVVAARENGVLKRFRSTPLPSWAYFAGRIIAATAMGAASAAAVIAFGTAVLHARFNASVIPELIGVCALGMVCFALVGLAVGTLVSDAESALAISYGTLLPVAFVSNVFFPATSSPGWLRHAASLLPVRAVATAAERLFGPDATGPVLTHGQLAVLGFWALGSAAVIGLAFRWRPGESLVLRRRRH